MGGYRNGRRTHVGHHKRGLRKEEILPCGEGLEASEKRWAFIFFLRDLTAQRSKKVRFRKGGFLGRPVSLFDKHREKC